MAQAPSKLGQFVESHWTSDKALLALLRDTGLVSPDVSSDELKAVFRKVRKEHAALPKGLRFRTVRGESVRVSLKPYLTDKGRAWAAPFDSLKPPDDEPPPAAKQDDAPPPAAKKKAWWCFW